MRVIHACGMAEAARDLVFSPGAAEAARSRRCRPARRSSATPDGRRGRHARPAAGGQRGDLHARRSRRRRRSPKARHDAHRRGGRPLAPRLAGAVVAIGNAPTALFRLLEAARRRRAAPRLRSSACRSASSARRNSKEALIAERPARHRRARARAAARWRPPPSTRSRARRNDRGRPALRRGPRPRRPGAPHGQGGAPDRRGAGRRLFRQGGTARQRARRSSTAGFKPSHVELPLYYPMTTELPFDDPAYQRRAGALLRGKHGGDRGASRRRPRRRAAERGRPALLRLVHASLRPPARALRGDDRARRHRHVRRWGAAAAPMTWGDDVLTVLPGTLPLDELIAPPARSPTPRSS